MSSAPRGTDGCCSKRILFFLCGSVPNNPQTGTSLSSGWGPLGYKVVFIWGGHQLGTGTDNADIANYNDNCLFSRFINYLIEAGLTTYESKSSYMTYISLKCFQKVILACRFSCILQIARYPMLVSAHW